MSMTSPSVRTSGSATTRQDNDANAKYKLGNTASLLTAGDSQSAYAMYISHKF